MEWLLLGGLALLVIAVMIAAITQERRDSRRWASYVDDEPEERDE